MQTQKTNCIYCSSLETKKAGKRKNKNQTLQRYQCKSCNKTFALSQIKNKTYQAKIILSAISYYNLGCTQEEVSKQIAKQYKVKPPQKTISNWVKEHNAICTFDKLRKQAIKLYKPKNIIFKQILSHIQPYTFKYHKAKLYLLFHNILYNNQFHNISHFYEPLKAYLEKISTEQFPHHIFTYQKTSISSPDAEVDNDNNLNNESNNNATMVRDSTNESASSPDAGIAKNSNVVEIKSLQKRASQIKFNHLKIEIKNKNNLACKLAKLALNLATTNKQRHEALQDFFLINDSTTIATEVPIYLTNWDAGYYRNQNGFIFPLSSCKTPITGHIDILQIRNGLIHILDYKPYAEKINAIEQLTIYALALSRKLNLPLYCFKCAWFDESNYFEFFPLHAVYEKQ